MAMYGRELIVCGGACAEASRKREGAWKQWRRKTRRVMAANATAEVEGQEPAALATKERIDAVAAPTAVVDVQVAMDKEEEDVIAVTAAAAEEHRDTAAGAAVVSTPSRWWFEAQVLVRAWATVGGTATLHAGNTSTSPIITADR